VARLGVGDFVGEIGILRNSIAQASVVAVTPGRVLWMESKDFLRFLANDFTVGLFFERTGTRRLGRAVLQPRKGAENMPNVSWNG
jgi:CRP-like cAMP-binding protein